jgi:hypothetical protein
LFVATSENGLNTTSKVRVFDLAVLGTAACDAAESTTRQPRRAREPRLHLPEEPFAWLPLPGCPGWFLCTVRHCVRTAPDHARRR